MFEKVTLLMNLKSEFIIDTLDIFVITIIIMRAWCKTIVTTSFYIRSYNSFAILYSLLSVF